MKKQLILLIACVLAGITAANATCWRINPSPFAKAQFKTVAEAMADINVLSGDTLLLDPGKHDNVDVSSRKNMTITGAGYFLDKNKQWSESQATIVGSVTLSKNSKIEGCDASYIRLNGDCIVSRCKVGHISVAGSNNIVECCLASEISGYSSGDIIRNNIVRSNSNYDCGIHGDSGSGLDGAIIDNNITIGVGNLSYGEALLYNINNSTIRNNIFINIKTGFDNNQTPYSCRIFYNCSNNVIQNNVLSTSERYKDSAYPNNYYVGATVENTFVNEGSDDGKWQLLNTSAAKGAATHGGDCGAFGGATPYVLSGIPMFLPHITEALVPAKPTNGKITVKLKIENQNE